MTTAQGAVARERLLRWADERDVPLTVRQVDELVRLLSRSIRGQRVESGRLTSKPRATADDARLIAARLEASFRGGVR